MSFGLLILMNERQQIKKESSAFAPGGRGAYENERISNRGDAYKNEARLPPEDALIPVTYYKYTLVLLFANSTNKRGHIFPNRSRIVCRSKVTELYNNNTRSQRSYMTLVIYGKRPAISLIESVINFDIAAGCPFASSRNRQ